MRYRTSEQELRFKRWLTKKGIKLLMGGCSLDTGGARKQYTPDFYLEASNVFIEIKPRDCTDELIHIEKAVEMNSPRMKSFSFFAVAFPESAKDPSSFRAFTADTGWVRNSEDANRLFYQCLGLGAPGRVSRVNTTPSPGRRVYKKPGKSDWDGRL